MMEPNADPSEHMCFLCGRSAASGVARTEAPVGVPLCQECAGALRDFGETDRQAQAEPTCLMCGRSVSPGGAWPSRRSSVRLCGECLWYADMEVRWLYPLETSTSERELPLHITCSLCGEEEVERFTYGADKRALKCGCAVCGDCFTSWCVAKVDDMCATIKCPMGSRAVSSRRACLDPVPQEAVQHALQLMPEHRRKYMMVKTDLLRDPHVKSCPGCGAVTGHRAQSGEVTCLDCSLKWCFGCHAPAHNDMSCEDFQSSRGRLERTQEKWKLKHTRTCPKCKVSIQRNEGCNHMHCTLCDGHFCYACGMALEDGDTAPYYHKLVCTKRHRHDGLKTAAIVITLPITVPLCLLLLGGVGIYEGIAHTAAAVKKTNKKWKAKRRQRKAQSTTTPAPAVAAS